MNHKNRKCTGRHELELNQTQETLTDRYIVKQVDRYLRSEEAVFQRMIILQ